MTHTQLIEQVVRLIALLQSVTEEVDLAAAERLRVNRTDLRCMSVLFLGGPTTAKNLAAATRLTPGAFTTALDRLARAGDARAGPVEEDRRRGDVELTKKRLDALPEVVGAGEGGEGPSLG